MAAEKKKPYWKIMRINGAWCCRDVSTGKTIPAAGHDEAIEIMNRLCGEQK